MKTNTEPREIDFKIWDRNEKTWVDKKTWEMLGIFVLIDSCLPEDKKARPQYIWQQFTGVLDKNKNKIFEGDIVRCLTGGAEYISEIEPIHGGAYWLKGRMINDKIDPKGKVSFPILQTYSAELEVIGNIFENSELLN